jgi:hypothetical protein
LVQPSAVAAGLIHQRRVKKSPEVEASRAGAMADRLSIRPKQLKLFLFQELFRRRRFHETILPAKKPFSAFGAELKKQEMVIKGATNG